MVEEHASFFPLPSQCVPPPAFICVSVPYGSLVYGAWRPAGPPAARAPGSRGLRHTALSVGRFARVSPASPPLFFPSPPTLALAQAGHATRSIASVHCGVAGSSASAPGPAPGPRRPPRQGLLSIFPADTWRSGRLCSRMRR